MPCLTLVPTSHHWLPGTASGEDQKCSPWLASCCILLHELRLLLWTILLHIPAGQFSWEAWEVGIPWSSFVQCLVQYLIKTFSFFSAQGGFSCVLPAHKNFWSSWQIFCLSGEKTYSWRFGDMLCIRIYTCPYINIFVCACLAVEREDWWRDSSWESHNSFLCLNTST